ncbi:PLC-like phosphodiesterase [Chaetomium sp. MPI-CAGE-AT-0009]|nr:PLC-like phosphodiesterase [Chaetomium sp. MPI-CAGE-AT-0009]
MHIMIWLQLQGLAALLTLISCVFAGPQDGTTPTTSGQPALSTSVAPIACNNSPDLCNRTYDNITHMGAHDSAFLRDASTRNSVAGNQYHNATVALSAGIRLLQAQVHLSSNTLELCHTDYRILDAGPLEDWLARIKHWLDGNPNDVVTLLLVNSDNQPASSFGNAFDRSGIATYAYTPPTTPPNPATTWPTLQALITANTRLITFIASIPAPSESQTHPYLLNEFDHVFETPYNTTTDTAFTCAVDRPRAANATAASLLLPLVNHFAYLRVTGDISIPAAADVDATNNPSRTGMRALGRHLADCAAQWGDDDDQNGGGKSRVVVFVLVDFYDRGPALLAADAVNGITAVGRTPEPVVGMGAVDVVFACEAL